MRRCWLLLVLAGCFHGSSSPAWPKSSSSGDDGGESLAPRAPAHEVTAQAEDSPGDTPVAPTATPAATPTTAPATTPAATTPTEEPVQTEEMVIEIEDD